MFDLKKLNSSDVKLLVKILEEQYGIKNLKLPYYFYKNSKDRLYISTQETVPKMRINNIGLYFANQSDNAIRLTIEGSQIIGPLATKNVIDITPEEATQWMRGEILDKKIDNKGFVIMRHGIDYYGCGRRSDDTIANFIPKSRRIISYRKPTME